MARNLYFSAGHKQEQNLYEDLIIESLKIYGQDLYYLPRDLVKIDDVFREDPASKFNSSYMMEMYVDNQEGYDGEGDLFSKFGIEIRDAINITLSRKRWENAVKRYDNEIKGARPFEGDLIFVPFSKKIFQIMHVEHEQPFYQLGNLPIYKLRCEMFEYSDQDFDTGLDVIQDIETQRSFTFNLKLDSSGGGWSIGEQVTQTLATGVIMSGEVSAYNDSDKIVSIIHAGANDGKYHQFVTGLNLIGSTDLRPDQPGTDVRNTINVNQVTESHGDSDMNTSGVFQNTIFKNETTGFLDFSESNPFGEVDQ